MQIKIFWAALCRRWYLLVVVLLAAVGATYLVVDTVGPTYEATGAVLVLPSSTTLSQNEATQANGNPYLALGGLNQVRDVAVRSLTSQAVSTQMCVPLPDPAYEAMREKLCQDKPQVVFDVGPDFTNSAPIVLIKADASTADNAEVALRTMMDQVPAVLAQLQAPMKLKPAATITSTRLVLDDRPEIIRKDQIRIGIVTAAGLLGLGLLGIALLDHLLLALTERRPRSETVSDEAGAPEDAGWWTEPEVPDAWSREIVPANADDTDVRTDDRSRQVEPAGRA